MIFKFSRVKENIALTGACLLMAGFCFSPALISIGVFLVFLHPFLNKDWKEIRISFTQPVIQLQVAFFLYALFTLAYTNNLSAGIENIKIYLPIILLPFGLYAIQRNPNHFKLIILVFIAGTFVAGTLSFINYLLNINEINSRITRSQPIPIVTGIFHIYYAILLAFATISGIIFLYQRGIKRKPFRILLWIFTFANFIFLHSISARTGLGAFYIGMFFLGIKYFLDRKKYLSGIVAFILLVTTGILSVNFIAPLNHRYQNTMKDINRYVEGKNPNYYSISMRLEAWRVSLQVIKENLFFGVGTGDTIDELDRGYVKDGTFLIKKNRIGPHNQYLQFGIGLGIIGLIIFLAILFFPVIFFYKTSHLLPIALFGILLFSFFFESVIERQVGASFFGFFWPYLMTNRSMEGEPGKIL